MQVEDKNVQKMANEIGSLVIKNRFSYNQTKKLFELVLDRLKDVPYQSVISGKE